MTEFHNYETPSKGAADWHLPLNNNFEALDADVEIRDVESNRGNYTPKSGAKFLATDTENIFLGDGSQWNKLASSGKEPTLDAVDSRRDNQVINLRRWRDDFGHGDIGASFNDASAWLADNNGGGTVYLPPGSYTIRTRMDWTSSNFVAPIRLLGAGVDTVDLSTSLDDKPILIDGQARPSRPEIGHLRFTATGMPTDNTFIALGDSDGPTFAYLHDLHGAGDGQKGYWLQNGFWLRTERCWFQGVYAHIGVSGENRGNVGYHHSDHYECHNDADYGVKIENAAKHHFFNCKMTGQVGPADLGPVGKHVLMTVGTELSNGAIESSGDNVFINCGQAVNADSQDTLLGTSPASGYPYKGVLTPSQDEFPTGEEGPAFVPDPGQFTPSYRNRFVSGHMQTVSDVIDYWQESGMATPWTENHSGGSASSVSSDWGVQLSTGASDGNIARLEFPFPWVRRDRHPVLWWEVGVGDTSAVRVEFGLDSGDSLWQYDTADGHTTWHHFLGGDGGQSSANTRIDVLADNRYVISQFLYNQGHSGVAKSHSGGYPVNLDTDTSGNNNTDSRSSTFSVSSTPYIEIESREAADKTLSLYRFSGAQRKTDGVGP